jgi:tRNA A-37 threonylcarbamoyl transferase component Bud32
LQQQASSAAVSATGSIHSTSSFSHKLAKWTKKVSGFSCGATLDSPLEDELKLGGNNSTSIFMNTVDPALLHHKTMAPEKPPRTSTTTSASSSLNGKSMSSAQQSLRGGMSHKKTKSEDFDQHTLATATTASATISYSTDQGDDASEMGMEVIMSTSSNDHQVMGTTNATTTLSHNHNMLAIESVEPYASHTFTAGKHTFTVDKRYTMIRTIGSGAYGVVISASDSKHNTNVAIKMVPKAFSDEIDAKRILREIKLLKHFRHDNIVCLLDMMPPNVHYLEDFTDVYLVADLMETDLHRIIYSKQKLSIDHTQYFIYQVLRGLKYIHSCRVLHRDLKPSNLLVNSNCDLKICDFGLARGIARDPNDAAAHLGTSGGQSGTMLLTEYVVTRWYRAPEIMLACHEYSYPIDVWSVGCIFAELILRKPYFPGDDYIDQVRVFLLLPSVCLCSVEWTGPSDFILTRLSETLICLSLQSLPISLENYPTATWIL